MGKLVLSIEVDIDDTVDVKGDSGTATFIRFHGQSNCENFKGEILPGGVDTQTQIRGGARKLSARYILQGYDNTNTFCKIFIENNGTIEFGQEMRTKPTILTDSYALKWLESADLYGTITSREGGGILISFYQEHSD